MCESFWHRSCEGRIVQRELVSSPHIRADRPFHIDEQEAMNSPQVQCSWLALTALALVSCHSSSRNNPFDPELTPAVAAVTVEVSDSTGVAVLEWSAYEGRTEFAEYLVLRREKTLVEVDTLTQIAASAETAFTDTSIEPGRDYIYWVEVVNSAGFTVASEEIAVQSFTVAGVHLNSIAADSTRGHVVLTWGRYSGPGFEGYGIWRRAVGEDATRLDMIADSRVNTWTDTTARPGTVYFYWLRSLIFGTEFESALSETSYELPTVAIESLALSSDTASAELSWSAYVGPRFDAYEIHHRFEGGLDVAVDELRDVDTTSYTDTLLDGNTEYFYRVVVRTGWGDEVSSTSSERSGSFYPLIDVRDLRAINNVEVQAIAVAVDAVDNIYVAASVISTTTARVMQSGLRVLYPGADSYRSYFTNLAGTQVIPHRLSSVRAAADSQGRLFVAVADTVSDGIILGAIDSDQRELWLRSIDANDASPAALYVDVDGFIVLLDDQGWMYRSDIEGNVEGPLDLIRVVLAGDQGIPLQHAVSAPGAGVSGNDAIFFSVPDREDSHIIRRTRVGIIYGGHDNAFDDGVGPDRGETLDPLIIAFDPSRQRLMVMEARGLLQVFDADADDMDRRFITRWGRFGSEPGEFQVSPPTAVDVVVDSQGQIHVADGGSEGGRIQVFAP